MYKKKGSENIIAIVPQANRTKGDKKSWLLWGGGTGLLKFPRKPEKISSPSDHLKSNTAYRNSARSKLKWRHLCVYDNNDNFQITSSATAAETLSVSSERSTKGHLKWGCQVHLTI